MRSVILTALVLATGCRDWSKPVIPQDPELAALATDATPPTRDELLASAAKLSKQGDAHAALRSLQRALAMHPADPQTEFLVAREYLALGERETALEFAILSTLHDASSARVVACAPIMVAAGAPQRAARLIESALPDASDAAVRTQLLQELVVARGAAGEHDGSLAAARELVATTPGAASQAVLGDALLRAGRLADAEDAFRAGITVDPKSTVCWNGLGTAALNRWIAGGKVDQSARARAVAAFEASLAVDADQPKVVRLMASHGL
ncbi:MAG: hypothetical protein FJ270_08575 [Planctomycetes bacterium]|nr:hypothetical protein [Planctomycetota bacterium]